MTVRPVAVPRLLLEAQRPLQPGQGLEELPVARPDVVLVGYDPLARLHCEPCCRFPPSGTMVGRGCPNMRTGSFPPPAPECSDRGGSSAPAQLPRTMIRVTHGANDDY